MIPQSAIVLALAMLLDLLLPEPPNAVHPVAWMGTLIATFRRLAPKHGKVWPFLAGLAFVLGGISGVALIGVVLVWVFNLLPMPLAWLCEALVLKTTFSIRSLASAGRSVFVALQAGNLYEARRLVSWHLVSRDTTSLDESQLAAATIESLAENTSDSIVAPLLFFTILGLPGSLAYRLVNTCDAMLGYRDEEREWLGKAPARTDDLLNLVPARLTAGLTIVAGTLLGFSPLRGIAIWWRDRRLTASPNAGHPMSAAAGVLGIELEKVGHYRLGAGLRLPATADIRRAIRLLVMTAALAGIVCGGMIFAIDWVSR